ncbi:hypothetical protein AJ78_04758 [Emergomyces pasteurianus Ep9510]|uniref:Micro-fibrillar-associated protein 1 C-terminal domain-containing protein n=1 Tax=Emergomyces pasteurianus Ep9510 TaxID=1447872 RepID=A0A1J9QFM5_9EURO|nr:hypothetical protein AJ78_04758 [Emergomyces pasteurianus Ep9510]
MPPPLPSSRGRMTANPQRPQRYRPGKPIVEEHSSEEEEDEEDEINEQEQRRERERQRRQQRAAPPPKATSFPAGATTSKITSGVQGVKLEEEIEDETGFVTEEEEEEDVKGAADRVDAEGDQVHGNEDEESEEESSDEEEEESSSEDEVPKRVLLRPTFIKKSQRKESSTMGATNNGAGGTSSAAPVAENETENARRKEKADILIRDQLEKEAAERVAGKKSWDDDENVEGENEEQIDDTDGLDPAAELAAWKLRELKRVKREREVIEQAEKEREEIERRRNLTAEDREREDREFISQQKEEREAGRGRAGFMQRYFHKGAFYHDDLEEKGLDRRDLMGSRYMDEVKNREALPQYLQVRDVTKIGRKGRTKYRDLRSEDTGRWGVDGYNRSVTSNNAARFGISDERFLPDQRDGDRNKPSGPTGANSSAVRDRPRPRQRSRSRSGSRPRSKAGIRSHRRSPSRSRSPPRSPLRRDRYRDDDRHRRKRSPSPYQDRDKRRRVDSVA